MANNGTLNFKKTPIYYIQVLMLAGKDILGEIVKGIFRKTAMEALFSHLQVV